MRTGLALSLVVCLTYLARSFHVGEFARPGDEAILVFGFILLGAFLAGELTARAGLPMITGYLIAGIVFGPLSVLLFSHGLALISPEVVEELRVIDHVALGLIAFTAGGELKLGTMRERKRSLILISTLQSLGSLLGVALLVFLLSPLFSFASGQPLRVVAGAALLLGASMVPNSPATVVAIMAECGARGKLTDTVLSVTVVKDIIAIVFFVLVLSLVEVLVSGRSGMDAQMLLKIIWEVGGSLLVGAALGWLIGVYIERIGVELPLVVIGLGFLSMYLSGGVQLSGLLICMAAGFTVENFSRQGEALIRAVEAYSLPVYVVFFTMAGAGIDLAALQHMWPLATFTAVVRGGAIYVTTRVACRRAGEPVAVQRYAWLGFIGQAGVTLGLMVLVLRAVPGLGQSIATVIVAVIAINQVVGPVAFRWAIHQAGEANRASR